MIRKWMQRLVAALILALLVVTVLHRDRYRSMCFGTPSGAPQQEESRMDS